ncbi:MAG: hypothetical protein Q8M15_11925 [Bacteroidota bacterium]|nr:hypothetical protein [Bacteroidota bacterium]
MKLINYFTTVFLIIICFSKPVYAQYKQGQKLISFLVSVNFENTNNTHPYSSTESRYLSKQDRGWNSQDNISIGLHSLKSDYFMISKSIGLNYYGGKSNAVSKDTFNQIHFRNASGINQINIYGTIGYTWFFPVNPKWGGMIIESNQLSVGMWKNTSKKDSADFVFAVNKISEISTGIGASLSAGLYYWIKPRIVLKVGISLLNLYYRVGYVQVSSKYPNQETLNNNYFKQSIDIGSSFTNSYSPTSTFISIQFLLK